MITNTSVGSYGRMGNGMFQIAAVIGLARRYNQPFGFKPWFNYDHKDRFGSTEDIDLQKYFINPLPELNHDLSFEEINFGWGYHETDLSRGNFDLRGHFQSDKYFKDSIDEIRYYFTMRDEYHQNACAVHWRSGDYTEDQNGYHPRLQSEYYYKAFEEFAWTQNFILFSDDIDGFYKMMGEEKLKAHANIRAFNINYIEDFKYMKSCHSFICANSSYSLMAAILADQPGKKIVCPSRWFGDIAGLDTRDIYPEGAIIL